jgi:hypothetical protein
MTISFHVQTAMPGHFPKAPGANPLPADGVADHSGTAGDVFAHSGDRIAARQ